MDTSRLKALPLFEGVSDEDLDKIAPFVSEVSVSEGKHLVDEGRFAYEFFVIKEGSAAVTRGGRTLNELGPGDFFGELGLHGGEGRRTASVVATSPLTVVVMLARDFAAMERAMPEVAEAIRTKCYEDRQD